eukprot:CAMPEP_0172748972 /NCGR_PEP_ID=MMETSP1074-20121228/146247_1 /TAXON_ID=2916 /ORGANISM="Ceratium fusus, Strain PA161109" /LENGTH=920 /DNA_ID=CAMNT_0013580813 /DNA_START=15 /DNA_END=2778 /DNA_ORIENTATION=+
MDNVVANGRSLQAKHDRQESTDESISAVAPPSTAGVKLVKYGCCAASTVMLLGLPAAPWLASQCCRHEMLGFDCWVWAVVSLGTLGYFHFLVEQPDTYNPLNTDESPREVAVSPFIAESGPATPISQNGGWATESTVSAKTIEPDPEPQQPVPTAEMCIQTDPVDDDSEHPSGGSKDRSGNNNSIKNKAAEAQVWLMDRVGTLGAQLRQRPPTKMFRSRGNGNQPQDREANRPPAHFGQEPIHEAAPPETNTKVSEGSQADPPRAGGHTPNLPGESEPRCCLRFWCCLLVTILLTASIIFLLRQFLPATVKEEVEHRPEVVATEKAITKEVKIVMNNSNVQKAEADLQIGEKRAQSGVATLCKNLGSWSSRACKMIGVGSEEDIYYRSDRKPQWHSSEWGPCSKECGSGTAKRLVYCIYGNFADCLRQQDTPPSSKPCSEHRGCKWHIGQWGSCNNACGQGSMERRVTCATSDGSCDVPGSKPPTATSCSRADGCKWKAGDWGKCDNQCGHGFQQRHVSCVNGPLENCIQHGNRPSDKKPCKSVKGCKWDPSMWTPCSNTCGRGIQYRNASCANGDTEACEKKSAAPRVERACHDVSGCVWEPSPWSTCSVTCGQGRQSRRVRCKNGGAEECLENTMMPSKTQICHAYQGCQWIPGEWSHCIAACGEGHRVRDVSCMNGQTTDCQRGPMLPMEEAKKCINTTGCKWKAGPWGPCSNVCGKGQQFRMVECGNGDDQYCRAHQRVPPLKNQSCKEMSGCLPLEVNGLARCNCKNTDTGLVLAGLLNAISGWVVSFTILHEMVVRANIGGNVNQGTAMLLSHPAVLIAGIGALAASSVLKSGVVLFAFGEDEILLGSGKLAVGVVGLCLWLVCTLRPKPRAGSKQMNCNCTSAVFLLAFCALVFYMAKRSNNALAEIAPILGA